MIFRKIYLCHSVKNR